MRFQSLGLVLVGLVAGVVVGTWGSGSGLLRAAPGAAAMPADEELPFHLRGCLAAGSYGCVGEKHSIDDVPHCPGPPALCAKDAVSNMSVNGGGELDESLLALNGKALTGTPTPCSSSTCYITITVPDANQTREQTLWLPVPKGGDDTIYTISTCSITPPPTPPPKGWYLTVCPTP
jgi:hypothetical protein